MRSSMFLAGVLLFGWVSLAPGAGGNPTKNPSKKNITPPPPVVKPVLPPLKVNVPSKPHKDQKAYSLHVQSASSNWKMDPAQRAALDKLLAQQAISDQERQQLSELLFSGAQSGLTKEDETA